MIDPEHTLETIEMRLTPLPLGFWLVTFFQARSWLVLLMSVVSGQQTVGLLSLFYPERSQFEIELATSILVLGVVLLSHYRAEWPRLWMWGYWLVLLKIFSEFIWQILEFNLVSFEQSPLPLLELLAQGCCTLWWLSNHLQLVRIKRDISPF